ncbi:hypothetical protein F1640_24510 [Novosphingobium sp. NBM11]|nr:hypothetical protein [Novosphingobium sp. NBM11]
MIVEWVTRGLPLSVVLTADTGVEREETYAYLPIFQTRLSTAPIQSAPETVPKTARRDRFSDPLVARAQSIFKARLKRDVSAAEARLMLGDLTDFYELAIDGLSRMSTKLSEAKPTDKAISNTKFK